MATTTWLCKVPHPSKFESIELVLYFSGEVPEFTGARKPDSNEAVEEDGPHEAICDSSIPGRFEMISSTVRLPLAAFVEPFYGFELARSSGDLLASLEECKFVAQLTPAPLRRLRGFHVVADPSPGFCSLLSGVTCGSVIVAIMVPDTRPTTSQNSTIRCTDEDTLRVIVDMWSDWLRAEEAFPSFSTDDENRSQ